MYILTQEISTYPGHHNSVDVGIGRFPTVITDGKETPKKTQPI